MILPEIVDLHTLCVWIHEVGHYMQNHLGDNRPNFVHEYEAEMYVKAIIALCPIEKTESYYTKNYPLLMHQCNLIYCLRVGQEYVKSFIDNEKNHLRKTYFLSKNIESYLETEFNYPEINDKN